MASTPAPNPDRRLAVLTGLLYLLTHVTSVTAAVLYAAGLPADGGPIDAPLVLGGVALEFVLALGCIGTGVLVWRLLREAGPATAAGFAALRLLEGAVIVVGTAPMLALVTLQARGALASGPLAALAEGAPDLHAAFFLLGQGLPISVNTILLGTLLWRSERVPRALAGLAIAGGAIVLLSNSAQLAGVIPNGGVVAGLGALPIFAFELWWALLLIVRGLRPAPAARAAVVH
ncbi:MAG: DUF4386 domain-containing protein [Actinomycetales bacterium]|nr:DUF4386 domain-containing protein [Actinomycetales bacterium]